MSDGESLIDRLQERTLAEASSAKADECSADLESIFPTHPEEEIRDYFDQLSEIKKMNDGVNDIFTQLDPEANLASLLDWQRKLTKAQKEIKSICFRLACQIPYYPIKTASGDIILVDYHDSIEDGPEFDQLLITLCQMAKYETVSRILSENPDYSGSQLFHFRGSQSTFQLAYSFQTKNDEKWCVSIAVVLSRFIFDKCEKFEPPSCEMIVVGKPDASGNFKACKVFVLNSTDSRWSLYKFI